MKRPSMADWEHEAQASLERSRERRAQSPRHRIWVAIAWALVILAIWIVTITVLWGR